MTRPTPITAFAPATVSNLVVGFDVLGFAVDAAGDRVTARPGGDAGELRVGTVTGVVTDLPLEPERNTATAAAKALLNDHPLPFGITLDLVKGIPLGSGMGGSAASAVAGVVAVNALLEHALPLPALLPYAVEGERAASGSPHADNAAPSLLGGFTAVVDMDPPEAVSLPLPAALHCVLVHPHVQVETRDARRALPTTLSLDRHVRQTMRLTGFLAACRSNDFDLMRRSMEDLLVEPVRAGLIPGFARAKAEAMANGAIGFGIAGSGPSVFALTDGPSTANDVVRAVVRVLEAEGVEVDSWVGGVRKSGAVLEDSP